ncbi:MAG: TlpA disulfide reductase family protein [Bdellovibrionota bacterium]
MKATELVIDKWLNTTDGFKFSVFNNSIKIIHAFQMLCPGCVYYGVPQTERLYKTFNSEFVQVIGLHTVFENHYAMQDHALEVFIKEWRLSFPVAIDKRLENEWMPETMKAYQLQGTPSLIIIDNKGEIKMLHFGQIDHDYLEEFIKDLISKLVA